MQFQTMAWSRPRQEWVLRPVKAAKNEEWRQDVRGRSHDLALERTKPTKTLAKEARLQGLPSRGHRVERPLRTELFRQNLAREERRSESNDKKTYFIYTLGKMHVTYHLVWGLCQPTTGCVSRVTPKEARMISESIFQKNLSGLLFYTNLSFEKLRSFIHREISALVQEFW